LVHLRGLAQGKSRAGRRVGAGFVLASQQTAGERIIRNDAEALLERQRQQFALDLAEQQTVAGLQ
jgi:hypothetical protein